MPVFGSPAVTFAVYNAFFTIAALAFDDDYPIYAAGLAWIAAATLALWLGYGAMPAAAEVHKTGDEPPRPALWISCAILAVLGFIGILLLNQETVDVIASGADLANIADQIAVNMSANYQEYETGNFVRSFPHALLPFTFAASTLGGLLYGLYPRRRLLAVALSFVVPVVAVFISGARTTLVTCFIMFFGTLIAGRMHRTGSSSTGVVGVGVSVIALVAVAAVVRFWRWGDIDELGYGSFFDVVERGWLNVKHGGFAPIPLFSDWLTEDWTSDTPLTWGARLLRGPAGLIGLFMGFETPRIYEPRIIGVRMDESNIFSIHRVLIEDFGLWSMVLFYVLGKVSKFLHERVLSGSIPMAVCLGAVYATIFMSNADFVYSNTVALVAIPLAIVTFLIAERVDRLIASGRASADVAASRGG